MKLHVTHNLNYNLNESFSEMTIAVISVTLIFIRNFLLTQLFLVHYFG